jgi:DNA-directed RNA polymerase subunit F
MYRYSISLDRIKELERELLTLIEAKDNTADVLKCSTLSDTPRGIGTSDKTLDAVERMVDYYQPRIDYIKESIGELYDLRTQVDKALVKLLQVYPQGHRVIMLRYIGWKTENEISQLVEINVQWMYGIIRRAKVIMLKELKKGH